MMIKKLLLSVLCVSCCAQSIPMNAFGGQWMRRTFSSRSAKWGAGLVACVVVGVALYMHKQSQTVNNPFLNNPKRRDSIIVYDSEDNDVVGGSDIEESELVRPKNVRTPLISAIINGNCEQVRELIKGGAAINQSDNTGKIPFMYAIEHYNKRIFGSIWNNKPDLVAQDNDGKNWMIYAIEHNLNQRDLNRILRMPNQSINAVDTNGQTPLHYAARANSHALISILVQGGCELNIQDNLGKTALHHALETESHNAIEELFAYDGIDINCADNAQKTPLMKCLMSGYDAFAGQLLERDDIQVQGNDNEAHSALYYAVLMGRENVVTSILHKYPTGANVDTELNLATNNGSAELIALINDYRNSTGGFTSNSLS